MGYSLLWELQTQRLVIAWLNNRAEYQLAQQASLYLAYIFGCFIVGLFVVRLT